MKTPQKFTIICSKGPVDDPTNWEFEIQALDVADAIALCGVRIDQIDAVIRSNVREEI